MGTDSDDDFERFLQEDDSASVSSASPVKQSTYKETKRKTTSASTAKSIGRKSSTSSTKAFGGSSLSVVAAAEKLLADSARAKAKKKLVVEEEDDEEEPPPSYFDDPYAFDLGNTNSGYAHHRYDDESDENASRPSSRRSSKSIKSKKGGNDTTKSKKVKSKSKDKDSTATKGEAKPAKTLEDRIAEILKRTGSTAYPEGVVAEDKHGSDDDENDYQHDGNASTEAKANVGVKTVETKEIPSAGTKKMGAVEAKDHEDSDEDSELHRLSFSDSLGMESADFEVGTIAKRKLDRSRLSLSSLNSEKFAVNFDALDESGQASQHRYDQHNEGFVPPADSSEPADSDYGDDVFELGQTTEAIVRNDGGKKGDQSAPGGSCISQFESMKSLFSLESPTKTMEEPVELQQEDRGSLPFVPQTYVPPDSDNFGYDDEDFETDEVVIPAAVTTTTSASFSPPTQELSTDQNGKTTLGGGEELKQVALSKETELAQPEQPEERQSDNIPHLQTSSDKPDPREVDTTRTSIPFKFEVVSKVISVTESTINPPGIGEDTVLIVDIPPPPMEQAPNSLVGQVDTELPPPPPPPDDHNDELERLQVSQKSKLVESHTVVSTNETSTQPRRSADRLRDIEQQVSTLRFVRECPPNERTNASHTRDAHDEHQHKPIIDDPEVLAEIQEIEQMMEHAKRARKLRRTSVSTRSSVKENELALRLQQAQRQLIRFKHDVEELTKEDDENSPLGTEDNARRPSQASEISNGDERQSSRRGADDRKILKKEHDDLKKEMLAQERLIQGFQRENELLMKQLKQLQRDVQYDVHKENEALRLELKELKTLVDGTPHITEAPGGVDDKVQYRTAIEARLKAEALATSLQEELKAQARRHQDRVNELKIELEKVKKAKIDLECRYEGISIEKMEAETREIKLLKEQLLTQKAEHDHAVSGLQKKIDWYVKNQRLLDEQDDKMSALVEENKRLKEELTSSTTDKARATAPSRPPPTPAKGPRLPSDVRRIQELESRLSEMEEAMRRRHPDSLVSLIVASRKADDESKLREISEAHTQEVAELTKEMEVLQTENEKKLNAFRQQQEKLVLQYQKQITDLERQIMNKENGRVGTIAQGKTPKKQANVDTDELYRVRRFYAEKIKEVERKWEVKYRAVKKQHYAASGPYADSTDYSESSSSDTVRLIRTLQQKVSTQEEEIRTMRSGSTVTGSVETSDLRRRILSLEAQLRTSEDARRHLVEIISSLTSITASTGAIEPRSQQSRQEELRKELEAKLIAAQEEHKQSVDQFRDQIKLLEQQVSDESTARQQLLSQITSYVKEVERLQGVLAEAEHEKQSLQQSVERVPALESQVAVLRDQLAVHKHRRCLRFGRWSSGSRL